MPARVALELIPSAFHPNSCPIHPCPSGRARLNRHCTSGGSVPEPSSLRPGVKVVVVVSIASRTERMEVEVVEWAAMGELVAWVATVATCDRCRYHYFHPLLNHHCHHHRHHYRHHRFLTVARCQCQNLTIASNSPSARVDGVVWPSEDVVRIVVRTGCTRNHANHHYYLNHAHLPHRRHRAHDHGCSPEAVVLRQAPPSSSYTPHRSSWPHYHCHQPTVVHRAPVACYDNLALYAQCHRMPSRQCCS